MTTQRHHAHSRAPYRNRLDAAGFAPKKVSPPALLILCLTLCALGLTLGGCATIQALNPFAEDSTNATAPPPREGEAAEVVETEAVAEPSESSLAEATPESPERTDQPDTAAETPADPDDAMDDADPDDAMDEDAMGEDAGTEPTPEAEADASDQEATADQAAEEPARFAPLTRLRDERLELEVPGKGPFPTAPDLLAAMSRATRDDRIIGDIQPFDAFPDIPGEDTVGRVFEADGDLEPGQRVRLFAFYAPGEPRHRHVYGYVVENERSGEAMGYFDGDGDGVFEQQTLAPVINPEALIPRQEDTAVEPADAQ